MKTQIGDATEPNLFFDPVGAFQFGWIFPGLYD